MWLRCGLSSHRSLCLAGFSFTKGCFANRTRVSATRRRSKSKKQKSQSDRAELNNDNNGGDDDEEEEEDVSVQRVDNTPEEAPPQSKRSEPIYFSGDDEDMNVDFNIDTDTDDDDVRNEENNDDNDDEDDGSYDGEDETKQGQNSCDREQKDTSAGRDHDDNVDMDPDEEQHDLMDEDSDGPPANTGNTSSVLKA